MSQLYALSKNQFTPTLLIHLRIKLEAAVKNKNFDILLKGLGPSKYPGQESEMAEKLFERIIEQGFDYDAVSSQPDYLVYASAEFLVVILPQIFDELIRRHDTANYIIFPVMSAIDPDTTQGLYKERANDILALADKSFAQKACNFLEFLMEDHPASLEKIERLLSIWGARR